MGRLDDIIARNQKALSPQHRGVAGVIRDALDSTQPPDDRKRKLLAWGIVLGLVAVTSVALVLWLRPDGHAPGGELKNQRGEPVELSTLWKEHRVVIMFYRSFYSLREQLSDVDAHLKDFDATVIGISTESRHEVSEIHEGLKLHFDLYADPAYTVISKWGEHVLDRGFAVFIVEPGGKISSQWTLDPPSVTDVAAVSRLQRH